MSVGDQVRLRLVQPSDLPIFFENQRDPQALRIAAFEPRDEAAFMAHWQRIAADPQLTVRTILCGGEVAGHIGAFSQDGLRMVGYWVGRAFWNRGVASRALELFLQQHTQRPLHAQVASQNLASIKVLQKNGFTILGAPRTHGGVEEYLLVLTTGGSA